MKIEAINKKQIIKFVLIGVAALSVSIGGVLAATVTTTDLPSTVALSKVDIDPKLEMLEDGKYVDFNHSGYICPGALINQRLSIVNKGEDCYVRIKFDFGTDNGLDFSLDSVALEHPDEWIIKETSDGKYMYRKEKIQKGSNDIIVYNGFEVPNWDNSSSGKDMHTNVVVQAIQADNFTPDYNVDNPWGEDVTVKEYVENA